MPTSTRFENHRVFLQVRYPEEVYRVIAKTHAYIIYSS